MLVGINGGWTDKTLEKMKLLPPSLEEPRGNTVIFYHGFRFLRLAYVTLAQSILIN